MTIKALENLSLKTRLEVLELIAKAGKGHIGGTFSCIEILVTLYFGGILNFNPKNPTWKGRDRFILSKGHACTAIYSIFRNLKIISNRTYNSYGTNGGLGGQLDINMPGVDFNTGSLGHSIGVASGIALAAKLDKKQIYSLTLIGDSEMYEGACWEAMIFASQMRLDNLIVIVDRNRLMVTDFIDDDGPYLNFKLKVESFGFSFFEVNGHSINDLLLVLKKAKKSKLPSIIVANTIKGKGVSLFENEAKWHSSGITDETLTLAKKELSKIL